MPEDYHIALPHWLSRYDQEGRRFVRSVDDRMSLAIELAARNVEDDLGGPFGAAVFESDSGRLLGAGVNRVMDQNCCVLHAEVMAIMLAQRRRAGYTLAQRGKPPCEIVSSCEPCAMCLGAITWSGVRRLVCGAREDDAFALGFDEGFKSDDWIQQLRARGIEVERDVKRDEACAVFRRYVQKGGVIYNPTVS